MEGWSQWSSEALGRVHGIAKAGVGSMRTTIPTTRRNVSK
jgi:hypothetical protein